jgi:hypothetical protein
VSIGVDCVKASPANFTTVTEDDNALAGLFVVNYGWLTPVKYIAAGRFVAPQQTPLAVWTVVAMRLATDATNKR